MKARYRSTLSALDRLGFTGSVGGRVEDLGDLGGFCDLGFFLCDIPPLSDTPPDFCG